MSSPESSSESKDCVWCGETIKANAKLCRFCNREQEAPREAVEKTLYEGTGLYPVGQLVMDLFLCLFAIGFITLPWHWYEHQSRRYKVTNRKVEITHATIGAKRIEVIELFRVQDMQYSESWGRGSILVVSADRTAPRALLSIPNARAVFDELQTAVRTARKEAGISVREQL